MSISKIDPIQLIQMRADFVIPQGEDMDELDNPRIISNSEVMTFLGCERRHYYAFILKLAPKNYSKALSRGLIGHEALAFYYRGMKEGRPVAELKFLMRKIVNDFAMIDGSDLEMLGQLRDLLMDYADYYYEDDVKQWEILRVEDALVLPLTNDFSYGMRLDLLVRDRQTGEVAVVDHKFIYDFYTGNQLTMDAQIPKYIGALRAKGVMVHKGILNQIRYRTRKSPMEYNEKFKRELPVYAVNTREIKNIMREQIIVSDRIMDRRQMTKNAANLAAVRNIHKMNCNTCSFLDLCKSELQGEDITVAIEANYRPNKYVELYEELGG